ncbi:putative zinc-binding protein [Paucibacter sp. AS339]|uniref:putative zinc-binding protein n=1 Tax=Paucibacter hankyongi TaxID=3133434 RepID=UPI0030B3ECF7
MARDRDHLPLVYSCSGCSSAAQLANHLALRLDRAGLAEMSCIAGVGGGVPSLVRKATEAQAQGRPIMALDGCVLACVKHSLAGREVQATAHIELHRLGVKKVYQADFAPEQANQLFEQLSKRLLTLQVGDAAPAKVDDCGRAGDSETRTARASASS